MVKKTGKTEGEIRQELTLKKTKMSESSDEYDDMDLTNYEDVPVDPTKKDQDPNTTTIKPYRGF